MFKKIGNFFKGLFDAAIKACKALLDLALPAAKQIIIGELTDFAMSTVKELNGVDLASEEKRKLAFERINAYAKENLISAKASLINLAIELAVQALKAE